MLRMRFLVLALVVAGCQSVTPGALDYGPGGGGGSGSGGGGEAAVECAQDSDCSLAAAKCCDCPAFAVANTDPAHTACTGVTCPQSMCPANTRAACDNGACVLACAPLQCQLSCPQGYAIDPTGCLECACAVIQSPSCSGDVDCVRTRADCCGCTNGGTDTAVPASEQAAYDDALMCPAYPQCPGGDTCTPGTEPRCIEGACELVAPTPAGACTGTCPSGQHCVLNSDDAATAQGLGVCM